MQPRIVRLYVNNYRSFVSFELRLAGRNLLIGDNGSGKSSVFDVLHAIRLLVVFNGDVSEVFPADDVTKLAPSTEQRFELDVETEHGHLHYALLLAHDIEEKTAVIALEELSLDDKPAYRFVGGEVELLGDGEAPAKGPFPSSPQRSFLASLDPKSLRSPIAMFKDLLSHCWSLRIEPARIVAAAPTESDSLARDASNFASYCRFLLQEMPEDMRRAHEALREIMPGFQHLRMQSAGRAKVLVATFRAPGRSAYDLDFDALSDGQKALIVLYVVQHCVAHHAPILCLDEPDNFVSIREIQPFLVELADISDETGLQILLVSHSAEVIDYASLSGALLFERPEGAHTRVRTIEATGPLPLSELMARGWLPGSAHGAA